MFSLAGRMKEHAHVKWKKNLKKIQIGKLGFMFITIQNRISQFLPKMPIDYTIVIIKQHTTTIQTLFSLIRTTQQEIKGNIFKHQTLSHHIFMNKRPFQKVKASLNSALKDLLKTCINLRIHGTRKLTNLEEQLCCWCFWMELKWNNCPRASLMMNDESCLTYGCFNLGWPWMNVLLKQHLAELLPVVKSNCHKLRKMFGWCLGKARFNPSGSFGLLLEKWPKVFFFLESEWTMVFQLVMLVCGMSTWCLDAVLSKARPNSS